MTDPRPQADGERGEQLNRGSSPDSSSKAGSGSGPDSNSNAGSGSGSGSSTNSTAPSKTNGRTPSGREPQTAEGGESQSSLTIEDVATLCEAVEENVARVIVGHEDAIRHVVTTLLARGHVLLDDVPGVGKTMLARSVARSVDCTFRRIQFTPDLLPSDVTGVNVFNQKTREFEFTPGPIFANVVLGDEINRAPPKTQSALLEAMEEEQVTVDGETRTLPEPFTVIATQNAVEPNRTYDLPFAEVDRFTKKLHLGYPDADEEAAMLARTVGEHPIDSLTPVTDLETLVAARERVAAVTVSEPVRNYVAHLVEYTRENATIGVSPRGSISLLRAAQARAAANEREYVLPDDVAAEAPVALPHRIEVRDHDRDAAAVVDEALERVPVE